MRTAVSHESITELVRQLLQPVDVDVDTSALRFRLAEVLDNHYFDLRRELGDAHDVDVGVASLVDAIRALGDGADIEVVAVYVRAHLEQCASSPGAAGADTAPVNDAERRYGLNESPT